MRVRCKVKGNGGDRAALELAFPPCGRRAEATSEPRSILLPFRAPVLRIHSGTESSAAVFVNRACQRVTSSGRSIDVYNWISLSMVDVMCRFAFEAISCSLCSSPSIAFSSNSSASSKRPSPTSKPPRIDWELKYVRKSRCDFAANCALHSHASDYESFGVWQVSVCHRRH